MSLTNNEIKRYGRQLVLPEIRKEGQLRLKNASVLIVGMGGLGSPCAIYLATAGVGKLGLLDHDVVDLSNIHRQITHSEKTLGISKVESAAMFLKTLNSTIQYELYPTALTSTNALEIVKPYDIVIDCSDNVATRYLMNDACVLLNKPLVSGSAIRFEGQLTVYHAHHSPCYRCLFPIPPPSSTVSNCDDVGVLGPITGILGSMQALEAIKYLVHGRCNYLGKLLLLDGNEGTFRVIPLRPPQPHCQICGTHPVIRQLIDYPEFCGSGYDDKTKSIQLLAPEHRVSVQFFHSLFTSSTSTPHFIDVRPQVHFEITHLKGAVNIPLNELHKHVQTLQNKMPTTLSSPLYIVCRKGNDSQLAVVQLLTHGIECKDIEGGLEAWAEHIDPEFPIY